MIAVLLALIPLTLISLVLTFTFLGPKKKTTEPCDFSLGTLPNVESIPGIIRCRNIDGHRQFRWYDEVKDRTLQKYSDSSLAPTYVDICNQWCYSLESSTSCKVKTQAFVDCETELKPSCLITSAPVAKYKDEFIFVESRGRSNCF